ncbi:MAG: PAS/PAC domain-containing protein [Chlorobi bacterium OLB5]|nr:MAG: PAS/PAC domain-containing protein [Chlorobi bacterium OLB5]
MNNSDKKITNSTAFIISLFYFIFGILWITLTGKLSDSISESSYFFDKFELYKGYFFIVVTCILLFYLIYRREQKQNKLEENLLNSEEKWKDIFESANDPIFYTDRNYRIIESNSKAGMLYGYSAAEFKNLTIYDLQESDQFEFTDEQLSKFSKGTGIELVHKTKENRLIPVEVSIKAVQRNNESGYIFIIHDLTSRRSIENKLIISENKYRVLVETSHELIWSTDSENIITFVNKASLNIYGLNPEEMIGKKFTEFATPEQIEYDKKKIEEALKKDAKFLQYESRITDKNNNEKYLLTNCIINRNSTGKYTGMFGTSLDITERFESEERTKYHNRVYSLLTNINQLIVRAKDKNQILEDACRLAIDYGMFRMAWIGIVNNNTGKIEPAFKYGDSENYLESLDININEDINLRGPIVQAFREKVYYVSNDVEYDPLLLKWRKATISKGFRSFACFPIEVKNKVTAVYCIYSEKKNFFGKTETELLLELAEDISFALEFTELEEERKNIEERYKNIAEKSPVGIFIQLNEKINFINPAGYKMLGSETHTELTGKNIFEIIHKDSMGIVKERLSALMKGKNASEIEEKFLKLDGSAIEVMVSAIPVTLNNQKGALVFFRDLTEQKKAQKEIFESNERFKMITKSTNDVIWDWNLLTNEIWWNESFYDIFGFSDDISTGNISFWESRIKQEDRHRVVEGLYSAINNKHDFWFDEYPLMKQDGNFAYVFDRGYIMKNEEDVPYRMVGSLLDLTYRKNIENKLKESEEKWRSLFEFSPSSIFTIDRNYIVTGINRALSSRTEPGDIIGKSSFDLIDSSETERIKGIIDEVFSSNNSASFNVLSSENDDKKHYAVQAIPQIKDNVTNAITFIATDITEKILADEKLKESNERLHALAAHLQTIREEERTMISREIHDQLGQELTALKMDIAFLSRKINKIKLTGKPEWDELSDGLKSMTAITDQTINSIRRIARELRPDVLDKLGLKDAIEWQAEEFTKRTGIDCIVSISPSKLELSRELESTVFRIIQESLTNVARHSKATRSKIAVITDDNRVLLSIEDNGIGISESEIQNAKSLGLVGIRERIYSVKGSFEITGKKNKGTKLNFIIPL